MMTNLLTHRLPSWVPRFSFAVLLLSFSELVFWQEAHFHQPIDWLPIALVYLALAALCLDLIARYRVRNWQSLLFIGGLYATLQNTLISVAIFEDIPATFLFYATGLQSIVFLLAFGALYHLYSGQSGGPVALGVSALVGLMSGVWLRWYPTIDRVDQAVLDLVETLPYIVVALVFCAVIPLVLPQPAHLERHQWMLTPLEWLLVLLILVGAFIARLLNDHYSILGLIISLVVSLIILLILWYLGTTQFSNQTDEDRDSPLLYMLNQPFARAWAILLVIFTVLAIIAYHLPGESDPIQASLLFAGLSILGIVWLPLLSVYVGVRVFMQLALEEY
jgi:hypothetical protein